MLPVEPPGQDSGALDGKKQQQQEYFVVIH
jgi:hypothetical protein